MEKELSKEKSKQEIEENNGNVCIKKSFLLKFLWLFPFLSTNKISTNVANTAIRVDWESVH